MLLLDSTGPTHSAPLLTALWGRLGAGLTCVWLVWRSHTAPAVQEGGGSIRTLHGWQRDRLEAYPVPVSSGLSPGRVLPRRHMPKPHANRSDRTSTRSSARSLPRLFLNARLKRKEPKSIIILTSQVASSASTGLYEPHTISPAPDSALRAVGGGADLRLVGLEAIMVPKSG